MRSRRIRNRRRRTSFPRNSRARTSTPTVAKNRATDQHFEILVPATPLCFRRIEEIHHRGAIERFSGPIIEHVGKLNPRRFVIRRHKVNHLMKLATVVTLILEFALQDSGTTFRATSVFRLASKEFRFRIEAWPVPINWAETPAHLARC